MFSSAGRFSLQSEHRHSTPPSPHTLRRRRAVGALRAFLVVAVTLLSVFTTSRIFFADVPLGGARDILTLYGATVALALGLAALFVLQSAEDEFNDGTHRGGRGVATIGASGIFRRTRDDGFRLLSTAMELAQGVG